MRDYHLISVITYSTARAESHYFSVRISRSTTFNRTNINHNRFDWVSYKLANNIQCFTLSCSIWNLFHFIMPSFFLPGWNWFCNSAGVSLTRSFTSWSWNSLDAVRRRLRLSFRRRTNAWVFWDAAYTLHRCYQMLPETEWFRSQN